MPNFTGLSRKIMTHQDGNIAEMVLADPLNSLRLEANRPEAHLKEKDNFEGIVEKIRALVPHYYSLDEQKDATEALEREIARAQHTINTGSSKQRSTASGIDNNGPNIYTPERMLLWRVTLAHMMQNEQSVDVVANELARSKGADLMLDRFSAQVTPILAMLGVDKKECVVRWGEPGSGFWFRRKSGDDSQHVINFDIHDTMLMGDYTQQSQLHELGHYLYDTEHPQHVEKLVDQIETLQKKYQSGRKLSDEEQRQLVRLNYEMKLSHRVTNAITDNAMDEGTYRLSTGKDPKYDYPLLPAMMSNFVTLCGFGREMKRYEMEGPLSPQALEQASGDAQTKYNILDAALLIVCGLRHGLMSDPEDRAAIIKDLPKLGIYPELLSNAQHPEWSGEKCFWDLYEKVGHLGTLTPDPALMATPAEWRRERDSMQAERNEIQDYIYHAYSKPLINGLMNEQKSMQNMMDALMADGHGEGIPINIPGGSGNIPVYGGHGGHDHNGGHGEGLGEPKAVGEHEKDASNGANARDPEAINKGISSSGPGVKGLRPGSGSPGQQGAGRATDAVAEINLGDGRTLQQLSEDPLFRMAIDQIKDRMERMLDQFSVPTKTMEAHASDMLPRNRPAKRLDKNAVIDYVRGQQTKKPVFFRGDISSSIPPVGDWIFALDTSGSMGWGKGSEAERVIKATALFTIAAKELNEERAQDGRAGMGTYIMLWGNQVPSFLGKPYDMEGQAEIIAKLDKVLESVFKNESISGLHGGTELEGVFKAVLEEYAVQRPASGMYMQTQPRGPALMVIGSDGHVFDIQNIPLTKIYDAMPGLTADTMLTHGQESALQTAMQKANPAEDYQRPLCVKVGANPLSGILNWMDGRAEAFRRGLPWGANYDVFTEGGMAEQAEAALDELERPGIGEHTGRLAKTNTGKRLQSYKGRES